MSKAFTKEDVDPPERSGRVRSASGLPPGATNYITPGGAAQLQRQLAQLRSSAESKADRIAELEQIVASITIVEPPAEAEQSVSFGARVTVRDASGALATYRIVGVDELEFDPEAVSWVSPIGRTLLAAELGDRVVLAEMASVKIVKLEYPTV